MAEKRLVGSDGALFVGAFGPDLTSGEVLVVNKFYKVEKLDDTSSVFPLGIEVGYLFRAFDADTLATDDICKEFEGIPMCDIQSWSMDFSKAEIDVSTLCDQEKVYRASKYDDVSGNMEGIMISGVTDQANALMNHFVTIATEDGTYSISPKSGQSIYAQLMTDDTSDVGEFLSFYFLPVVLTGFSASAGGDDAQTFSSPFRAAPSDSGIVYYKFLNT